MKVGIIYPNTESSRFLTIRLLESGHDVSFYCPSKFDVDLAQNIIFEANMVGSEQDKLRRSEKSFSVEKNDLSDCDFLVIPWLDIKNKTDLDYQDMCFNLFSMMKAMGISLPSDGSIIFGHNVSGLSAAKQWGKVWPNMKKRILVTCSIFRASQKIYGLDSGNRALPYQRNPVKITYSSDACEEVVAMEGKWTNNSFVATETRLLFDLIKLIHRNDSLDCLGVVGKFITTDESVKYGLPEDSVFWIPTEEDAAGNNEWYKKMLPTLRLSSSFRLLIVIILI